MAAVAAANANIWSARTRLFLSFVVSFSTSLTSGAPCQGYRRPMAPPRSAAVTSRCSSIPRSSLSLSLGRGGGRKQGGEKQRHVTAVRQASERLLSSEIFEDESLSMRVDSLSEKDHESLSGFNKTETCFDVIFLFRTIFHFC